jgi:hypothetical protein
VGRPLRRRVSGGRWYRHCRHWWAPRLVPNLHALQYVMRFKWTLLSDGCLGVDQDSIVRLITLDDVNR